MGAQRRLAKAGYFRLGGWRPLGAGCPPAAQSEIEKGRQSAHLRRHGNRVPPPTPPARVATSPARDSAPRLSPRHHAAPRVTPAASRDPTPPPRAQPHPGPGGPRSLPRSLFAEPTLRPRGQAPPHHARYPGPKAADWALSSALIDRGPPRTLFSGSSSRFALAQAPVTSDWCSSGSLSPDWLSRTACGPPGSS